MASATRLGGRVFSRASSALSSTSRRSSGGKVATKEALSISVALEGSAGAALGASLTRRLRASYVSWSSKGRQERGEGLKMSVDGLVYC